MTVGDWQKSIKDLLPEDREQMRAALETLRDWPTFKTEFEWTGIFTIETLIRSNQSVERIQAAIARERGEDDVVRRHA
jgi:hypothetical protein